MLEQLNTLANDYSAIADWLAGIGTLAAVVVSLWLARRDSRTRLRINADGSVVLALDSPSGMDLVLSVTITNVGIRPVTIASFGFGLWPTRQRFTLPVLGGDYSLPKRLEHGEEVRCTLRFDPWAQWAAKEFAPTWWKAQRLRLHVRTTLGDVACRRIGSRARKHLHHVRTGKPFGGWFEKGFSIGGPIIGGRPPTVRRPKE